MVNLVPCLNSELRSFQDKQCITEKPHAPPACKATNHCQQAASLAGNQDWTLKSNPFRSGIILSSTPAYCVDCPVVDILISLCEKSPLHPDTSNLFLSIVFFILVRTWPRRHASANSGSWGLSITLSGTSAIFA